MPLHIQTPLLPSAALATRPGQRVWLKMEALQPSGSFKLRGIGLACETYAARGARRFISSSGGNAGLAVAHAGRALGVPVLVIVPETTSERAKQLIGQQGAEVQVHGASWQEANALALSLRTEADAFIHPFDDPLLWAGHASMVEEVLDAGLRPDAVLLAVGGGGLLCGVVQGLRARQWTDVPVVAVETVGADSLAQALLAKQRVELPGIASIASSLGARQVCEQAFAYGMGQHPVRSVVVSDRAAVDACLRFLDEQRVLVEPACGAALALLQEGSEVLAPYDNLLVIVCGGATATLAQLQNWAAQL
jgi:L-serine/L-threonine ammonia-lyase